MTQQDTEKLLALLERLVASREKSQETHARSTDVIQAALKRLLDTLTVREREVLRERGILPDEPA